MCTPINPSPIKGEDPKNLVFNLNECPKIAYWPILQCNSGKIYQPLKNLFIIVFQCKEATVNTLD